MWNQKHHRNISLKQTSNIKLLGCPETKLRGIVMDYKETKGHLHYQNKLQISFQ